MDRWDAGFGRTIDENAIHRENNNGVLDTGLGVVARGGRHAVKFGANVVAGITNTPRRQAYDGIYGATRADAMEVLTTPIEVFTKKKKIGRLVNGVAAAFDVVLSGAVDTVSLAAGDHANKAPRRNVDSNLSTAA